MANLPQVGLEAVIANLSQFNAGARSIQQAYDDINTKAGTVEKATGGLGTSLTGLGSKLLNIGAIAGGAALAGVAALGAGLATFAVTGINKAIDLDAQMATIAATMNTTKDAVGPLKDLILDLALDPNLTVNTTQAADAIQLLAQNGATTDDIIGGLAKSTVALANATGADFGVAANTASGVMKVFNLEAKDMGIAVDGITGVVNQSKFGIDDYAQAFSQAGSVAAGMGVSLQDFNTVITATADSFTSGSDAGTSFKTLLQRLANPTKEVQKEMEKYGISLFDASGNMRPLSEVAGQLNTVLQGTATITSTVGGATKEQAAAAERASKSIDKLTSNIGEQESSLKLMQDELGAIVFHYGEGSLRARKQQLAIEKLTNSINENKVQLTDYQSAINLVSGAQETQVTSTKKLTEAEKAELAAVIGGADAARIVLALSQTTAAEFDNLSGKVNDVGQAFRAAATRVDSVKGAFEIFQGIIEAVQIQVGDKFLPLLRDITVGFTDLASKAAPGVVEFFGKIADTVTTLVDKTMNLIDIFGDKGLAGVFAALGLKGSALFLKKLGKLVGMFGFVGDGATTLSGIVKNVLGGSLEWLVNNIFPMLSKGVDALISIMNIGKLLATGDFSGGIFGLEEDSGFIDFLFTARDTAISAFDAIIGAIGKVTGAFERFGVRGAAVSILGQLGLEPDQVATILQTIDSVFAQITEVVSTFMSEGLFGGVGLAGGEVSQTGGILEMLGLSDEAVMGIQNIFLGIIAAVTNFGATWQAIWPTISAGTQTAWVILQGVFNGIAAALTPVVEQLKVSFTEIGNTFASLGITWATVGPALLQATGIVFAAIGAIILGAISIVVALVAAVAGGITGMIDMWNELMPSVVTIVGSFITFLTGVTGIFSGIITGDWGRISLGFQTAWAGIAAGLTAIVASIVTIFTGLVGTVSKIISGFVNAMVGFWTGLYDELVGHSIVYDIIDGIVEAFTSVEWMDLGLGIVQGIVKGITDNAFKVYEKLKGMALEALAQAGEAIGWNSPATAFIPLGASIPEGIVAGINSGASSVASAMGAITQGMLDSLLGINRGIVSVNGAIGAARDTVEKFLETTIDDGKSKRALQIMGQIFRDNSDTILTATDRAAKFRELLAKVNFGVNNQQQAAIMGNGVNIWLKEFDKNLARMKAAQRQVFIEAGRTALTIGQRLNDIVGSSVEILDTRVKDLQDFIASGAEPQMFQGEWMNQWLAQIRLNEALEEQREIQDDILQLKQNEQKLTFLEKQLSLVETLNEAGLDVNDILGGITLGLDASIPDMIEATNRLVMAMIEQVNKDLQLGSPSKVMMKKGLFAGEGFAEGMLASIPDVMGAMKKAIIGPSMVSGPVLAGGSNSRVTNNNFSMNVNSGASPQSVMAQFEIARAMA